MVANVRIHDEYCRKIKESGDILEYDTEIPRSELYHLAYPDAAWYVNTKIGFGKVPLIVFEVLYSEREKAIRGSISSLLLYGSPIGILVMITEGYRNIRKSKTAEENVKYFKTYVRNLIKALGLKKRIYIWDESNIDSLLNKHKS
jgi:hypothetical protein